MPKPKHLLVLFTPLIFLFVADSARSCTCSLYYPGGRTIEEKVINAHEKSSAVFFGRLVEDVTPAGAEHYGLFRFEVIRAWKGIPSKEVTISTTRRSGLCGFPFETNANYLVYASGPDEKHLSTNRCDRTTPAGADTVDFLFLGEPEFETANQSTLSSGAWKQESLNSRRQESPPQLELRILSQSYNRGDDELDGVKFDAILVYTNVGRQPVILEKGSNRVSRVMVGRSADDLTKGNYELNSTLTWITTGGNENELVEDRPGHRYIVIEPGAAYELNVSVGIFAVRGDQRTIAGAVHSGRHFLQVKVATWTASNDIAERLKVRWSHIGSLWYAPATSLPVEVVIPKERTLGLTP